MNEFKTNFTLTKKIDHIAFIMDGNGRWAKAHNRPRTYGHKVGCDRLIDVFEYCKVFHIKYMSFYAFSTENWKRPKSEISQLFKYLEIFFKKEIDHLMRDGVKIIISGDISPLPSKTQKTIKEALEKTHSNDKYFFNICLNYGSRDEIIKVTKEISALVKDNRISVDEIDAQLFNKHLYTNEMPDVDLLIRTSGEERLSNFLLYQSAYAEFVFPKVHWPDFTFDVFVDCLQEFEGRNRRFGGIKNEKEK